MVFIFIFLRKYIALMTNTKKNKKDNNNNKVSGNDMSIELFKKRIEELEAKNITLEDRFAKLEERQAVLSHVNSMLTKEVERLSQYTRRSNIVIRNIFLPADETVKNIFKVHCEPLLV